MACEAAMSVSIRLHDDAERAARSPRSVSLGITYNARRCRSASSPGMRNRTRPVTRAVEDLARPAVSARPQVGGHEGLDGSLAPWPPRRSRRRKSSAARLLTGRRAVRAIERRRPDVVIDRPGGLLCHGHRSPSQVSRSRDRPSSSPHRTMHDGSIQHHRPRRHDVHDLGWSRSFPAEARWSSSPPSLLTRRASSNHTQVFPVLPARVPQRRAEQATS